MAFRLLPLISFLHVIFAAVSAVTPISPTTRAIRFNPEPASINLLKLAENCVFPNITDTIFIRSLPDALIIKIFDRLTCNGCLTDIIALLWPSTSPTLSTKTSLSPRASFRRSPSTSSHRSLKSLSSFGKSSGLRLTQSLKIPSPKELSDYLLDVLSSNVGAHSDKDGFLTLPALAVVFNHFELAKFLIRFPALMLDEGPSASKNQWLLHDLNVLPNTLYQLRFRGNPLLLEKMEDFICPSTTTPSDGTDDRFIVQAIASDNYICLKYITVYNPIVPISIDLPPLAPRKRRSTALVALKIKTSRQATAAMSPSCSRSPNCRPMTMQRTSSLISAPPPVIDEHLDYNDTAVPTSGINPYLEAAKLGNLELFSFLTSTAYPDYFLRDPRPLFIAAKNGDIPLLTFVLKMGVDLCAQDGVVVHEAMKNHQVDAVRFLAFKGVFLCHMTAEPTYLLVAYASTTTVDIVHFLLACEANVRALDDRPLLNAIKSRNWDVVSYLVEMGANPCVSDALPLRLAAAHADVNLLKLMVKSGATMCTSNSEKVMYNALLHDNEEVSRWVVEEGFVDPTRFLKQSIAKGDWGYTKYLITKGADACVVKCNQFKSCSFKKRMYLKYKCWGRRWKSMWRKVTGQKRRDRKPTVDIEREQKHHERVRDMERVGKSYKDFVVRTERAGPQ